MSSVISPLAFVSPSATLADNVTVMPFAYIDEGVEIGEGCCIYPYASVLRGTHMGKRNNVFHHTVLGAVSQSLHPIDDSGELYIGDDNVFREHVVIAKGIERDHPTRIGNHNFLMAAAHVCYGTRIQDHIVLGLKSILAGMCEIESHAIVSTACSIFEKVFVGRYTLIRGGGRIKKHVPPFISTTSNPATFYAVNVPLLEQSGFSDRNIRHIAHAYEIIYRMRMAIVDSIIRIRAEVPDDPCVEEIITFLEKVDASGKGMI